MNYQVSRIRREEKNSVKTPAEKKPSPRGGVVFETSGPALVVFERAVDARCLSDTLYGVICEQRVKFSSL